MGQNTLDNAAFKLGTYQFSIIIKIPQMQKLVLLVILGCLLGCVYGQATKMLNVTCGTCKNTTACGGSSCYIWTSGSYMEQTCTNFVGCGNVPSTIMMTIAACTRDIAGTACPSKVCFFLNSANNYCYVGVTSCPAPITYNYTCGNCVTNTSCSQCLKVTTNATGAALNFENCTTGYTSCTGSSANAVVQACTGTTDSFGFTCPCCLTGTYAGNYGYCSSTSAIFTVLVANSNGGFINWFNSGSQAMVALLTMAAFVATMVL